MWPHYFHKRTIQRRRRGIEGKHMQINLAKTMDESSIKLGLPGFRFHPTEEELLNFYLKNTIMGKNSHYHVIGILNIYRHDPWFLPGLARIGEREWYFFVPRDRTHGSGGRPNRTTEHGFWKATGSDRKIVSLSEPRRVIGLKKTLVFYKGRAPRGTKTDWIMNEYRLPPDSNIIKDNKDKDIVLCKVYRKATSLKVLEQRAAKEEEEEMNKTSTNIAITNPPPPLPISMDRHHTITYSPSQYELDLVLKKEEDEEHEEGMLIISEDHFLNDDEAEAAATGETTKSTTLQLPTGMENLGLQLPKLNTQVDPFHAPLCSPWLDNWLMPYANILNL